MAVSLDFSLPNARGASAMFANSNNLLWDPARSPYLYQIDSAAPYRRALAAYNAAISYQEVEEWHAAIGSLERFAADSRRRRLR